MTIRLWGQQQRVNADIAGAQRTPSVTQLNNGNLVVVWSSGGDVFGRILNPAGGAITGDLLLAGGTDSQIEPGVTALANGTFQLFFTNATAQTVTYRNYSAAGVQLTSASLGANAQDSAAVSTGSGSSFVSVFRVGDDLQARFFDAGGFTLGPGAIVSADTGVESTPDITRLSDGRYAVTWHNNNVFTRIMNSDGTFATIPLDLNSNFTATTAAPRVAPLQGGAFVVIWNAIVGTFPGAGNDIRGRIVDSAGNVIGASDFLVNVRSVGAQFHTDVVALNNGGFLAVWLDQQSGINTIRAQAFNGAGERVGSDILVSNVGNAFQAVRSVSATLMADGRVAVTWVATQAFGDSEGIGLQILDPRDGYVEGSTVADLLYGGDFADQVLGLAGDDTVFAGFGDDVVYAGIGNDTASGDAGSDLLYGQDGADTLNGADGDDGLFGGIGADRLVGFTGADTLSGEDGNDTLFGEDGNDFGYGGAGADTVNGGNGDDYLTGFDGNDELYGGPGNDQHFGEAGDDRMAGFIGDDFLDGGEGNDQLFGEDGNDGLYGGPGNDLHVGGNGDDRMAGFTGDDQLEGDAGNDELFGEDGNDGLYGGAGNDFHSGGEGNDRIAGSDGDDTIDGGGGNDEIYGELGADLITGGSGADRYIYFAVEQSRAFGADFIVDYSPGLGDTLELNLIDANVLVGGDQAFTVQSGYNGTAGQAVVYYIAASNITVFEADTNGDNISDFILQLAGNQTALTGFVL